MTISNVSDSTPLCLCHSMWTVAVAKSKGTMHSASFLSTAWTHRPATLVRHSSRLVCGTAVLARLPQTHSMSETDCIRTSTNCAHFMRTLSMRPKSEWMTGATSVLDHHFDVHKNCGDWCVRKKQLQQSTTAEQNTDRTAEGNNKFCHCMTKDAKLCSELTARIARFTAMEGLEEVGHGWDTQVNESLNDSVTWLAPKNKHCSGSQSLKNRIAAVVCINGVGILEFHKRLFQMSGISVPPNTLHCLTWRDRQRSKRIVASKKTENEKR